MKRSVLKSIVSAVSSTQLQLQPRVARRHARVKATPHNVFSLDSKVVIIESDPDPKGNVVILVVGTKERYRIPLHQLETE